MRQRVEHVTKFVSSFCDKKSVDEVIHKMEKDSWEVAGVILLAIGDEELDNALIFKRPLEPKGEDCRTPTAYSPREDALHPSRLPGSGAHGRAW